MTIEDPPLQPDAPEAPRTPATPVARLKQIVASSSLSTRMVIFSGIGCLIALVILAVVAVSISRSSALLPQNWAGAHASGATSLTASSIPKPSPIGRAQPPEPQVQLPQPLQLTQPARQLAAAPLALHPLAAPPVQHRAASAAPPAPAHVATAGPSLPFGVRMVADRDGFNNGCRHGRLVLEISTVTFTCPHDASKDVSVSAGQVKGLDNNGIVVFPRQKYHFDIAGREKQNVHELFAEWLANARRSASARASN